MQFRGSEQFIQLTYRRRTCDRGGDAWPGDLPCQRHAGGRGAVAPTDIIQCRKNSHPAVPTFALRGVRRRAVFSTEKSGGEGEVAYDANVVLQAQWFKVLFVLRPCIKIVLWL